MLQTCLAGHQQHNLIVHKTWIRTHFNWKSLHMYILNESNDSTFKTYFAKNYSSRRHDGVFFSFRCGTTNIASAHCFTFNWCRLKSTEKKTMRCTCRRLPTRVCVDTHTHTHISYFSPQQSNNTWKRSIDNITILIGGMENRPLCMYISCAVRGVRSVWRCVTSITYTDDDGARMHTFVMN